MTWQLWLARPRCREASLPWLSPQNKLASGGTPQGFASALVRIGTPAKAPKPHGKSPDRATAHCPAPRNYYPAAKNEHINANRLRKY